MLNKRHTVSNALLSEKMHKMHNLLNITLKDLKNLSQLIDHINEYADKYVPFRKIVLDNKIRVQSSYDIVERNIKDFNSTQSHGHGYKKAIHKVKDTIKDKDKDRERLSTINKQLGEIRQYAASTLIKINEMLCSVGRDNFFNKKREHVIMMIDDAIREQVEIHGESVKHLFTHEKSQLPSFSKFKQKLQLLLTISEIAHKSVTAAFQFEIEDSTKVMTKYYEDTAEIVKEYDKVIDFVVKFDVDTLIDAHYKTVPWLNRTEKERINKVNLLNSVCIKEGIPTVGFEHYNDFQLAQVYKASNSVNYKKCEFFNLNKVAKAIMGERANDCLPLIKKFHSFLEEYYQNQSNPEICQRALENSIQSLLDMPKEFREKINTLSDEGQVDIIKILMINSQEFKSAKLYGKIITQTEDPLASKIYQILKDYINDSSCDKSIKRQASNLTSDLLHVYLQLSTGMIKDDEAFNIIQQKLNSFFKEYSIKPDTGLWKLVNSFISLLPNDADVHWIHNIENIDNIPPPSSIPKVPSHLDKQSLNKSSPVSREQSLNKSALSRCNATNHKKNELVIPDSFGNIRKAELINQFLAIIQKHYATSIIGDRFEKNLEEDFPHIHDLKFTLNGNLLVSNIIQISDKDDELFLKDELKKQALYFKGELINTSNEYKVIINLNSVNAQKMLRDIKVLENQIENLENECKVHRKST